MTIFCTIVGTLTVVSLLMCLCIDGGEEIKAVGHIGVIGFGLCVLAWVIFSAYCAGMYGWLGAFQSAIEKAGTQ